MLRKTTVTLIFLFLLISKACSQSISFDSFKGTSYHIPFKNYTLGYGDHVNDYRQLSTFEWENIEVSERTTVIPFPDVPKNSGFGIVFKSQLTIKAKGCYEFDLNSDDGSKLWIEGEEVIDNGGNHKMVTKKDTIQLYPGSFESKIWYQQLYPNKYGLIFKYKALGDSISCELLNKSAKMKIILDNAYLFETGKFKLQETQQLDSVIHKIVESYPSKITVIGHTDNIGNEESNMKLSLKRAIAVQTYLLDHISDSKFKIIARGLGDQRPIEDNSTSSGRANNRRVEIILE